MKEIHFICPNRILLTLIERPDDANGPWVYESGNWDLRPDEPALVVGGIICLHQSKAKPSYFGGRIDSYREIEECGRLGNKVVFRFTASVSAKDVKWRGAGHARGRTGGVVDTSEAEPASPIKDIAIARPPPIAPPGNRRKRPLKKEQSNGA